MTENTLSELKKRVALHLKDEGSGHGFDHIMRVYKNALLIAKTENANDDIIVAASILHDVGDHKLNSEGREMHREMIEKLAGDLFDNDFLNKVIFYCRKGVIQRGKS